MKVIKKTPLFYIVIYDTDTTAKYEVYAWFNDFTVWVKAFFGMQKSDPPGEAAWKTMPEAPSSCLWPNPAEHLISSESVELVSSSTIWKGNYSKST